MDLFLEQAREKFNNSDKKCRERLLMPTPDMHDFCKILGSIIPDKVSLEELLLTIKLLLKDIQNGKCGFNNSSITQQCFKTYLPKKKELGVVLSFIPRYVQIIADKEFAQEFKDIYGQSVLGQASIEELGEEDYGCIEIEKNVIDISNKNKADVLAALYNNSQAQGLGAGHFDPTPMTGEIAEMVLEKMGTQFGYLKGRPLKVSLDGNIIYVHSYNNNNGDGEAQRAISKCPNIEQAEQQKVEVEKDDDLYL